MSDIVARQLQSLQFEYENIQIERITHLVGHYSPDAVFKDPFQEVVGHKAISQIFLKMFAQLDDPSFKILSQMHNHSEASLLWEFNFRFKRWNTKPQSFKGVSWLKFNASGLIESHIDYWDVAEGVYEKLPLIGAAMRFLKKHA